VLANAANPIINSANGSAYFREVISAAYVMGDARLLNNRLRMSGGVRFERTEDTGFGVRFEPVKGYITNAAGQRVLNPDVVARARAQYSNRGDKRTASYSDYYPSFDASFNVTHDLIARFGYAKSIGRPDLGNIIPTTVLPDLAGPAPYAITTVNSSLEPTETNSFDVSLEYYFTKTGVFSVGAFQKDFKNFVGGSIAQPATVELLNELNVPDPASYVAAGATVATSFNVGEARVTGVEFNYSQVLDAEILPRWMRRFTIYANGQKMHLQGSMLADFSNFIPESASWGIKYGANKFSAQVNWNWRGRQRLTQSTITYQGAAHTDRGFYNYFKPRLYCDVNVAYRVSEKLGFFVNARNLTNLAQDFQFYGPTSPSWSRTNRREEFGVQYTIGVKGNF
jgi:iron complex outermembrane recepter protein